MTRLLRWMNFKKSLPINPGLIRTRIRMPEKSRWRKRWKNLTQKRRPRLKFQTHPRSSEAAKHLRKKIKRKNPLETIARTQKSMIFSMWFSKASLVFFNLATLTKHRYLRIQTNFFIFSFFIFFIENWLKIDEKMKTRKTRKMTPGGIQNDLHFWRLFRLFGGFGKKGTKKYVFWGVDFSWFFGWPKKSFPGVMAHIDFSKNQAQASLGQAWANGRRLGQHLSRWPTIVWKMVAHCIIRNRTSDSHSAWTFHACAGSQACATQVQTWFKPTFL